MLRRDYMGVCGGDACAAMLLAVFEGWTQTRLKGFGADGWIYRSRGELRADTLGAFGYERLDAALEKLRGWEFIDRRHNPKAGWDRKWQYRLNIERVQQAINGLNSHSRKFEYASSENRDSILRNPRSNTEDSLEDSVLERARRRESVGVTNTWGAA